MLKDTKSLGNNKAPACESRGFVRKKQKVCILTHLLVPSGTKAASPTIGSTSPNEGPRNDPQSLDDRKQAFFPP